MPEYQKPKAIERGVERLIEPYKTYRIQKDGKTTLLKIKEVGSTTLSVEDMATHKTFKINKATFQNDLDNGRIYVSSRKALAEIGEFTVDLLTLEEARNAKNQMGHTHVYTLDELKQALLDPEPYSPTINFYDDDMNYSTNELMRDLKDLPAGYTVSRSSGKVKVKRAFTGPAHKDKGTEKGKKWVDPGKEEFERLFKENQKNQNKPRLKVLQALAKVVK